LQVQQQQVQREFSVICVKMIGAARAEVKSKKLMFTVVHRDFAGRP
jgi:hypothetical protein